MTQPTPPKPAGAPAPTDWFADETTLLAELKAARATTLRAFTIPGYDVHREIKRGGQGVVFEARQLSTGRRVAIKVLRDWTLDHDNTAATAHAAQPTALTRRFSREIELAAALRHPGIVRVYDSGRTTDGRTYLVMEYVEGLPLDEWAASVGRDQTRILEVMARVCDAVQVAHTKGVIHRDIKPSNIRVDAEGQPRVLDFGLAKIAPGLLGAEPGAHISATLTESGQFVGSLPWAAPEQVNVKAEGPASAPDTRSDVYALGAVLYQLLTGHLPCDITGGLTTALRNITEVTPRPARLHRADLAEPVEVILAKALAKEPAHRYQSAAELAEDLRLHLAGEPIRARREGAWRQVRRRVRRYQLAMTVGLIGAVALGVVAWYALDRRAEAERALEVARERTRQQDAFTAFLTGMLGAADAGEQGKDVKVADVLRKASADVPVKFAQDQLTAAKMYGVLAQTFRSLGLLKEAGEHNALAIEAARKTGRELTIADVELIHAKFLNGSMGQGAQAEPLVRAALAVRERRLGDDHPDTLDAQDVLATSLQQQGKFDEAEGLFRRVLQARQRALGDTHRSTVVSMNNLAALLRTRGRFDEALAWFEKSTAGARVAFGPEHFNTLITTSNMANCLVQLNRCDEAAAVLRTVLQAQERTLGADHPLVAGTLSQLGSAMQWSKSQDPAPGDPDRRTQKQRALDLFARAVQISEAKAGPNARNTLVYRSNYAVCLSECGRHEEALVQARRAHEGGVATLGPEHWQTLAFHGNVAQCLSNMGQHDQAIALTAQIVASMTGARGPTDHETLEWIEKLVLFCTRAGRNQDAAKWQADLDARRAAKAQAPAGVK